MSERDVQDGVLLKYGSHPDIRMWRQNTGLAYGYGQVKDLISKVHVLGTMKSHGANIKAAHLYDEICKVIQRMQPTKYSVVGMPDIIGFVTYERPDGCPWARTIGIECKGKKGIPSPEQIKWGEMCELRGGIWILAYSVEDVTIRLQKEGFDV